MASKKLGPKVRLTTVRLPESLARALDKRAKAEGIGRSELIRQLLETGLGRQASPDRLDGIEEELRKLRREVRGLAGGKKGGRR